MLYYDITDLIAYFKKNPNVTGIQRVSLVNIREFFFLATTQMRKDEFRLLVFENDKAGFFASEASFFANEARSSADIIAYFNILPKEDESEFQAYLKRRYERNLESERTQVHLEGERSDRKVDKWQTAALEAAKQCGNPWLPEISPVQPAASFIESARGYDLKLIASLAPGARPLKSVLSEHRATAGRQPKSALWLVGPEGDFTPAELNLAQACGFAPITLGPLVLRCETAAVYALSVLGYELGST